MLKYLTLVSAIIILIFSCVSRHPTTESITEARRKPNSFENGKNLVFNICGQCHYDTSVHKFIGRKMEDLPRFIGKVYSANLTHSSVFGVISRYTDSELAYLLKTGIARNGRYVPYMIRPNLAEEDINDILIYLRSDDPPLSAEDKIAGKTRVTLFGRIALRLAGKPMRYMITKKPNPADASGVGRYLVDNLACYHCHSGRVTGLNYRNPEKSKGYLQGGMEFKSDGELIYASNLTPDTLTGIGRYNLPQFIRVMRLGIRPDRTRLQPPMQQFPMLTDEQIRAIFLYLKIQPPKNHLVTGHVPA